MKSRTLSLTLLQPYFEVNDQVVALAIFNRLLWKHLSIKLSKMVLISLSPVSSFPVILEETDK